MTLAEFRQQVLAIAAGHYSSVRVEVVTGERGQLEVEWGAYIAGRDWFEDATPEGVLQRLRGAPESAVDAIGEVPSAD